MLLAGFFIIFFLSSCTGQSGESDDDSPFSSFSIGYSNGEDGSFQVNIGPNSVLSFGESNEENSEKSPTSGGNRSGRARRSPQTFELFGRNYTVFPPRPPPRPRHYYYFPYPSYALPYYYYPSPNDYPDFQGFLYPSSMFPDNYY